MIGEWLIELKSTQNLPFKAPPTRDSRGQRSHDHEHHGRT